MGKRGATLAAVALVAALAVGPTGTAAAGLGPRQAEELAPAVTTGAPSGLASIAAPAAPSIPAPVVAIAASGGGTGYWMVNQDGDVPAFGTAQGQGGLGGLPLASPVVGMAATPSGHGYWLVASDGGVFAFGDAGFFGSTGAVVLNRPVVGMAATPSGHGYWLVASDGGVFAFGDAGFFGSTGAVVLNRPVVGMAATPSGHGYWLVASDGGVFAFGDAGFFGSTGAMVLNRPVVGMAATPSGHGYWLVASDGGVFTFGAAGFFGALPARPTTAVAIHSVLVTDPTRSTPARGPTPTHSGRVLPTTIWYPTSGPPGPVDAADAAPLPGPFPLVVFAHGFNTNPAAYEVLVHAWAEAGYVVAAPEFPISGSDPPGPASESDLVNQPGDMSAVITFLLNGGWGAGVIDPRHVAVAGHSDGGDTVVAATLNSAYHDSRITAAMSLSGALINMPGGSYGSVNNVPLLVVQGDADTINPPSESAAVYNVAHPPKAYLDIVGGGHLPPYISPGPQSDVLRSATIDFLDAELLGDPIAPIRLGVDGDQTGYTTLTAALG